jgi:hypothetical protein
MEEEEESGDEQLAFLKAYNDAMIHSMQRALQIKFKKSLFVLCNEQIFHQTTGEPVGEIEILVKRKYRDFEASSLFPIERKFYPREFSSFRHKLWLGELKRDLGSTPHDVEIRINNFIEFYHWFYAHQAPSEANVFSKDYLPLRPNINADPHALYGRIGGPIPIDEERMKSKQKLAYRSTNCPILFIFNGVDEHRAAAVMRLALLRHRPGFQEHTKKLKIWDHQIILVHCNGEKLKEWSVLLRLRELDQEIKMRSRKRRYQNREIKRLQRKIKRLEELEQKQKARRLEQEQES